MGVDASIIIGHKLSIDEIMSFPAFLDNCQELKDVFLSEIQSKLTHRYTRESVLELLQKGSSWGDVISDNILEAWRNNSNPAQVDENGYFIHSLSAYFGHVEFHEKAIILCYFPEHKYGNLQNEPNRRFMLKFSRAFAQCLQQEKIVYCPDSYEKSEIERYAIEGKGIEEIISTAIECFGQPSDNLEEAIADYFFIDDVNYPVEDYKGR